MNETALQYSGWLWTLTDHALGFLVSMLTVHLLAKAQKIEGYKFSQSVLAAAGYIAYSFALEAFLPMRFLLPSIPLTLIAGVLACKAACHLTWKKGWIIGSLLFLVTIVFSVFEGIARGLYLALVSGR